MVNPEYENGLVKEIMDRSRPLEKKPDVSIQIQLPNEWSPDLAKKNIGISAYVESDKCNPQWILSSNQMDQIIVPSNHVKTCIENTGALSVPLTVIPEAYYDSIVADDIPPLEMELSTDFNFLLVGQITGNNPHNDRKNIFNTLKWFCEAFKDDSDVGLVFKTNSGRNTKIDRKVTRKLLSAVLKEVRPGEFPKIHFLHGSMTQDEMAALYRHPKIKAFISLTRGEGFGLPLLEAAASGLPVIATNWSGHLDFMGKGKFVKVQHELQDIHPSRVDGRIFVKGSKWAEPTEADAKKRLTKFRKSHDTPLGWAKDLQPILVKEYSQSNINMLYSKALSGLFE